MEKVLWLDCSAGIAGDMLVAALIDAGGDRLAMERALASLPEKDFSICVSHVEVSGVRCVDFDVMLAPGLETHDHDMAYLYGDGLDITHEHDHDAHEHAHDHGHDHDTHDAHEHSHDHGQDHEHEHAHAHGHHHRTLGEVLEILAQATLSSGARALAERAFTILADAEAAAHGKTRETVLFHEVGAIDSIVDVVAASVLLDGLSPDAVYATNLTEGTGSVRTAHGVLPVPVPAVAEICRAHELSVCVSERAGELITPTGAALLAALSPTFSTPGGMVIEKTGYGAGKRSYPWANFVRASVGRAEAAREGRICKLECEVDDATGEAMGETIDRLLEAGAREAHWIPLGTKKGRPAWQLQVICLPEDSEALELEIFRSTTTIGLRRELMDRTVLPREKVRLALSLPDGTSAEIEGKRVTLPDSTQRTMPEADDVAALARKHDLSYQLVWQAALAACAAL